MMDKYFHLRRLLPFFPFSQTSDMVNVRESTVKLSLCMTYLILPLFMTYLIFCVHRPSCLSGPTLQL